MTDTEKLNYATGLFCTEADFELLSEAAKNAPESDYYENEQGNEISICASFEQSFTGFAELLNWITD